MSSLLMSIDLNGIEILALARISKARLYFQPWRMQPRLTGINAVIAGVSRDTACYEEQRYTVLPDLNGTHFLPLISRTVANDASNPPSLGLIFFMDFEMAHYQGGFPESECGGTPEFEEDQQVYFRCDVSAGAIGGSILQFQASIAGGSQSGVFVPASEATREDFLIGPMVGEGTSPYDYTDATVEIEPVFE